MGNFYYGGYGIIWGYIINDIILIIIFGIGIYIIDFKNCIEESAIELEKDISKII